MTQTIHGIAKLGRGTVQVALIGTLIAVFRGTPKIKEV